jgi:AbrB family looped-hinge helix DNA binding protein
LPNLKYQHLLTNQKLLNEGAKMVKSAKAVDCGCLTGEGASCCNVEAVVSVDGRGQLVLPKDVREKSGIKAGDKLAVIAMKQDGEVCCLALVKVESLAGMVKEMLGPLLKEIK